jgi:hypothetical protein
LQKRWLDRDLVRTTAEEVERKRDTQPHPPTRKDVRELVEAEVAKRGQLVAQTEEKHKL